MCMNVVYSSDNNYTQHLAASLFSLLHHNADMYNVFIYIIDNEISKENKEKLKQIVCAFPNCHITWIDYKMRKDTLDLNMPWQVSISAYARLFIASMLPTGIKRVLYLDCDTIVCGNLAHLWEMDLRNNIVGGVLDAVHDRVKIAVGLEREEQYINSGVLLIDLEKWIEQGIEHKCLAFISDRNGTVIHHDQGVLNGVLQGQISILPMVYNVMTIHYMFSLGKIQKYYRDSARFYDEDVIENARRAPLILHFTPSFTCHPWEKGCKHPLADLYWKALSRTPWHGVKPKRSPAKWHVRLYEWRYRTLPF